MKSPDVVFGQLARLYDFYREISKFKGKRKSNKRGETVRATDSRLLRR